MSLEENVNQTISFITENNEEVEFCVIEQTKLNGVNYLLVTEDTDDEEEVAAYILKDVSSEEDEEAVYDMVEDEKELEAIAAIFDELLEDTEIETE